MKKKPQLEMAYKSNPKYNLGVLKEFPDLTNWLKQISRYNKIDDFIYISDYKKGQIRLTIFTKDNQYYISAHLPKPNLNASDNNNYGYLGCITQTRKPRASEDWNRGRDLPDGKYCIETWQEIKDDILAYELVKVVRNSADIE